MTNIKLIQGDITKIQVEVIVNAANASLLGGGGVDGAIHRAGGPAILAACRQIRAQQGGCAIGEAVLTTAGKLPAQKVIHTVGPIWNGRERGKQDQLLANCYQNSLTLAVENDLTTIAFPNISTGVYCFPKQRAAKVALKAVRAFLQAHPNSMEEIVFVCFDADNYQIYQDFIYGGL